MKSLEAVFVQSPDSEVYSKLESLLQDDKGGVSMTPPGLLKGVRCTKKAYGLFESRGNCLLAHNHMEQFKILLLALRKYATPTLTSFKNFERYGISEMMLSWLDRLMSLPQPHPLLTEVLDDFVTTIGVIADYSVSMMKCLTPLIPSLLKLASDHYKSAMSRFEVTRVLNDVIQQCSLTEKRLLTKQHGVNETLIHIGANLHNAGDFELQVGLLETLSRLTDANERRKLGPSWFDRANLTHQYLSIREQHFDIDCRYFLNNLNRAYSFIQSVYSIECSVLKVGSVELHKPADMSEFWVDFNTASESISFFVEDPSQNEEEDQMWSTVYIKKHEIQTWDVTNEGCSKWRVNLLLYSPPVTPLNQSSSQVSMWFNTDPHTPLLKTIGRDKEVQSTGTTDTSYGIPVKPKSSVAMVPVKVSSPPSDIGVTEKIKSISSVSPVTPDENLDQFICQLSSSQGTIATPNNNVLRPKTPGTSTPKVPYQRNTATSLGKAPSSTRANETSFAALTKPQSNTSSGTDNLSLTTGPSKPIKSGRLPAKTHMTKQPSNFSDNSALKKTARNQVPTPDSDFTVSKRLKPPAQHSVPSIPEDMSRPKELSRPKRLSTTVNKPPCDNNISADDVSKKINCSKTSIDTTFDFPESPKKSKPTRKRKRKYDSSGAPSESSSAITRTRDRVKSGQHDRQKTTESNSTAPATKSSLNDHHIEPHDPTHIDETIFETSTNDLNDSLTKGQSTNDLNISSTKGQSINNLKHSSTKESSANSLTKGLPVNDHSVSSTKGLSLKNSLTSTNRLSLSQGSAHRDSTRDEVTIPSTDACPIVSTTATGPLGNHDNNTHQLNTVRATTSDHDTQHHNEEEHHGVNKPIEEGTHTTPYTGLLMDESLISNSHCHDYDSDDDISLSSFHSSQIEPDMGIIGEFERTCQNVLDKSVKVMNIPSTPNKPDDMDKRSSSTSGSSKGNYQQPEIEPQELPLKRPRLMEATPLSLNHDNDEQLDFNMEIPSINTRLPLAQSDNILNKSTSGTGAQRDVGLVNCANNRDFLFSFNDHLVQEIAVGSNRFQKAEEHCETAIRAIEHMNSETSSVNELLMEISKLYQSLYSNLATMKQHEDKISHNKCLSIMEELKLYREAMLKQSQDHDVQHMRKAMKSLVACWQML